MKDPNDLSKTALNKKGSSDKSEEPIIYLKDVLLAGI
jgi:hypothetical protein